MNISAVLPGNVMPRKSHEPDKADAQSALVRMHADEPYLPLTEAVLRCHSKRRLFRALRQADSKPVAEWLFADARKPFHPTSDLSSTSFEHSLAITGLHRVTPPSSTTSISGRNGVRPGSDLLFVPASVSGKSMLGYSFGGVARPSDMLETCPVGDGAEAFVPHAVGRFAFDGSTGDLVLVIHGMKHGVTVIMHVRGTTKGSERERNTFVVPGGLYGHRRLPGRVLVNVQSSERRMESLPRFQFVVGMGGGGQMRDGLAILERVMKGRFLCPKMVRDDFDDKSGEVLMRSVKKVEAEFDARDAVGMQVLRDQAMRMYFSYMSALSRAAASGTTGGTK